MRHDLVALWIFDPIDRQLPDLGRLTIEDAETGEQVSLDSGRASVRDAYAAETERRRQGVLDCMRRGSVPVLELDTTRDYLPPLVSFLARRPRVRRAVMKTSIFLLAAGVLAFPAALAAQDPRHSGVERDASVLDQDIRDIKGPVEIPAPRSSLPWVPLGAGALVLGAAGFAALRMARRTRTLTAIEAARASFAAGALDDPRG